MTLAIASVAVIMFACKKENEPQTDNFNPNPPETQAVIDHVNAFKSRIEYYKANPAVKDGETESISDAMGRLVMSRIIRGEGNLLTLGIEALAQGMYLYQIYDSEKELLTGRFIKD